MYRRGPGSTATRPAAASSPTGRTARSVAQRAAGPRAAPGRLVGFSLKASPLGHQPFGEPLLDLLCLPLAVAAHHQIVDLCGPQDYAGLGMNVLVCKGFTRECRPKRSSLSR